MCAPAAGDRQDDHSMVPSTFLTENLLPFFLFLRGKAEKSKRKIRREGKTDLTEHKTQQNSEIKLN